MKNSMYLRAGKPLFDFISALTGLLLLFPVFVVIALIVKMTSKGPVFFRQERVGKDFKLFRIFKFRTMEMEAEKKGLKITTGNDKRITGIGRVLRKTKLDELPQLINVLFGQMSLVGPRPEVDIYVNDFRSDYNHILSVKPGITDYAALEYSDEESLLKDYKDVERAYIDIVLPEKIKLYNKYIKDVSLLTDVKIIAKTVLRVLR